VELSSPERVKTAALEDKVRRLFNVMILTFSLVAFPMLAQSDTIDVLIRGVDDGVKTNKQQDYKEAVMNAKLEAIERAGVEIISITKIVNFKTKYDKVESKAKAALLPGFQIMDMGYQSDGTYTVVLSGKVRAGKDAEDRAERRKQAIQKEISTLEAKLADVEVAIIKVERVSKKYRRRASDDRERDIEKCYSIAGRDYQMRDYCVSRINEMKDRWLRELNEIYKRKLGNLPEEKTQLELRLSELRVELSEYSSDTKEVSSPESRK
jgi:hypothetical protein